MLSVRAIVLKALGSSILGWVLLGCAVIVGALVLYYAQRYVMVVATSYSGALAVALGVGAFLPGQHVDVVQMVNDPAHIQCTQWQCYVLAGAWVILGTMGLAVQVLMYDKPLSEADIVEQMKLIAAEQQQQQQQQGGPGSGSKTGKSTKQQRNLPWKKSSSSQSTSASRATAPSLKSMKSRQPSYSQLESENRKLRAKLTFWKSNSSNSNGGGGGGSKRSSFSGGGGGGRASSGGSGRGWTSRMDFV